MLEYCKSYSKTTGSFWNYYRDEPDSGADNNINYSIQNSKSFDYKTREKDEKDVEIVVSLKYLSNFWRALDIPLINWEINLILTWSENCVLTSKATRDADPDANPAIAAINANVTIKIKDAKLYVPVVTLPNEKDKILLKKLRTGFKRTIKWNKYRSEITNHTQNHNLNYLIDPTFIKVNRLLVLLFEKEEDLLRSIKYQMFK